MNDPKNADHFLSYAQPSTTSVRGRRRWGILSIAISLLSVVVAAFFTFREGLTNQEAISQMWLGRKIAAAGIVLAAAVACVAYRRPGASRALAVGAGVLAAVAMLYIYTRLPPW